MPRPLPTVRVAYIPFEGAAQVLYAQEQGYFAKEGLNVELQPNPYGAAIAAGVASSAADIGFSSIVTLAIAHRKQIPFVIVAPAVLAVAPNSPQSGGLLVAATSSIRSGKDLNGKTLCTAGLGTLVEFAPRVWIDANGGDSSTVKFIEVPFSGIGAAIAAGRCDGGYVSEPYYTPAKRQTRVLAWTLDAISKNYLAAAWFTTSTWARDHADAVRRFDAAMRDAAAWANAKPHAVDPILVKDFKVDPSTVGSEVRDVFAERLTPELLQPSIDVTARYMQFPTFPANELIATPSR